MSRRFRMCLQGILRHCVHGGLRTGARIVGAFCVSLGLLLPANAQFWGGWNSPQPQSQPARPQPMRPNQQQQPQQQQQYSPFQGFFGGPQQQHLQQQQQREQRGGGEVQLEFSRAPNP